jgi:hypothetical protein
MERKCVQAAQDTLAPLSIRLVPSWLKPRTFIDSPGTFLATFLAEEGPRASFSLVYLPTHRILATLSRQKDS